MVIVKNEGVILFFQSLTVYYMASEVNGISFVASIIERLCDDNSADAEDYRQLQQLRGLAREDNVKKGRERLRSSSTK